MTLEGLLLKVISKLNKIELPYMITGGIAANYYGSIRATEDLDICIKITENNIEKLVKALNSIGLERLNIDDIKEIIKTGNRFFCYEPKKLYRIDFWLVKKEYQKQQLARRKKGKIGKQITFFISLEDLIVEKFIQSRGRDIDDIYMLIKVNKKLGQINYSKLKEIAQSRNISLGKFEQLIRNEPG